MSKHARTPGDLGANEETRIYSCLYHRCEKHALFPQLNHNELGTDGGSECGACIGEEVFWLEQRFFDMLDLLALHLTQSTAFKVVLKKAVERERLREGEAAADALMAELTREWKELMSRAIARPKPNMDGRVKEITDKMNAVVAASEAQGGGIPSKAAVDAELKKGNGNG
jgi:hypothetical protein